MMSSTTRNHVKSYLSEQVVRYWDDSIVSFDSAKLTRPLHAALAPRAMRFWSSASSHSFYTRTGSWWQKIACLIGADYHVAVRNGYSVTGQLSNAAEAHITQLTDNMNSGSPRTEPNRTEDIESVLTVQTGQGPARTVISDIFLLKEDGTEIFVEIKTPEPNKAHCMEMKRRILTISALRKDHKANAFAACAYNPSNATGGGTPYSWHYTPQFLEIGKDGLVGKDFWSLIGEDTTYDEIVAICAEVGNETDLNVLSALGLN